MLYLSVVYALAAALVFVATGMTFLVVVASVQLREYAAARNRIRHRLSRYVSQPFRESPRDFANYFVNPQRDSINSTHHTTT
jgi:hypothetical protein